MKIFTESDLETTLSTFEDTRTFENTLEEVQKKNPCLFAFLFSESFDLLTAAEKEYLLYLFLVIWKTISYSGTIEDPTEEIISETEEKNWELFTQNPKGSFASRLDPFFLNYPQEDLLAFVEDALLMDVEEGPPVTKEGREVLFVALKSIIDLLT